MRRRAAQMRMNIRARGSSGGFSLIELLIVVAIILIIAAIAIPNFMRARMAANESSAANSLRTLNSALVSYNSLYRTFPNLAGAAGLSQLGPPAAGSSASSAAADLIEQTLASGIKSGYTFAYTPGAPGPSGLITSYTITAEPTTRGTTGQSGFFTDQSVVIRKDSTAPATAASTPL